MLYKNVSKKVLAFGMAFATACSAIFSMPQGVLAGTFIGPTAGTLISVVDYKNYPNQEMAYKAATGGQPKGDEYGFSIRGDTQFYWVTKANQASRPTSFRYNVFGWTIVVTGSSYKPSLRPKGLR